jgi:outer membrane protein assembly factor BamB
VAMDLKTGAVRWNAQMTEKDNFVVGCPKDVTGPVAGNCPTPLGPDVDFGASPILIKMKNGKDMLVAGQKSSEVYGIDPDTKGKVLWKIKLGRGGAGGGVRWGMASEGGLVYVALNDAGPGGSPSIRRPRCRHGQDRLEGPDAGGQLRGPPPLHSVAIGARHGSAGSGAFRRPGRLYAGL